MNFIEELTWRGMLNDLTPGTEELLKNKKVVGYIGFDPTAPSMTIGNLVQILILKIFQNHGHTPVVLMGGATGRIGDPSGKDKERLLKTEDELDSNLQFQVEQMKKYLNFETGANKAILLNNYDFYKNMNVLDFLRDVGKNLTVNYMLSKDSVKNRLETGISFTEFSYQLLQAYDFLYLYQNHDCILQMGGSDQWGNITTGTEFIRRNVPESKAYAVTTPLLTKSDGKKFGKSEEGNIWLDSKLTSPYKFYQFFINVDDAMTPKLMRYFSYKSKEEIEKIESDSEGNPQAYKKIIAEELTRRIHSDEAFLSVMRVTEILFNKKANVDKLNSLSQDELEMISKEIPSFEISKNQFENGVNIVELLSEQTTVVSSKSDARRAIKGNALSVNKAKITDLNYTLSRAELLHGKYMMVENGKKNKFIIKAI